jgi:phospholipid-binding lipoprotein MlaA
MFYQGPATLVGYNVTACRSHALALLSFCFASLVALVLLAAASPAVADGLFPSPEPEPPRPWFGETVDHLYQRVEDGLAATAARLAGEPAVVSVIKESQALARRAADSVPQMTAQPGANADAWLQSVALPEIPGHVGVGTTDEGDPLEPFNRMMFALNWRLRRDVFDPASDAYRGWASPGVQASVHNFFANLREPLTIASDLLEGRLGEAGNAAARLGINTTIGIAGVSDQAAALGYPSSPRNLEQTLCAYRLPTGPYLVLPVLGPATLRDSVGRLAAAVAYYEVMGLPLYVPYRLTDIALQYSDLKDKIRFVDSLSADPYLAQRTAYLSTRTLSCEGQALADKEFFEK